MCSLFIKWGFPNEEFSIQFSIFALKIFLLKLLIFSYFYHAMYGVVQKKKPPNAKISCSNIAAIIDRVIAKNCSNC